MTKYGAYLCFCFFSLIVLGCTKTDLPPKQQLESLQDNNAHRVFYYDGDKIARAVVSYAVEGIDDTTEITYTYSTDYIKADFITNKNPSRSSSIEYFLNAYNLPDSLVIRFMSGTLPFVDRTWFYYRPGTEVLDSVVQTMENFFVKHYPYYTGKNISQITMHVVDKSTRQIVDSSSTNYFTYSATPNIVRSQHPLVYLYAEPFVISPTKLSVALLFSANTMDTFTFITPSINYSGRYSYSTDTGGRITSESCQPGVYPYKRTYSYR